MKLYYVANARMPTEKAHGIQIAKMCEALIEEGHKVTLVVPARASGESLRDFYGLRVDVPLVRLSSFVFGKYGRLGYALMGGSFMITSLLYLWWKRLIGERFWIYTVDIDTFSHTLLPLAGPTIAEMHSPKTATVLARFFFRRAKKIVATNPLIQEELARTFRIKPHMEPNGVDLSHPYPSREDARAKLSLGGGKIALYVGRFYLWKGLEALAPASRALVNAGIRTIVLGGTKSEFERVFGDSGALEFFQARPAQVGEWMVAADVLLLLGTAKNEESNRYTAPMKTFEYLSTGRPVVASETQALRSLIPPDAAVYCVPDDPHALVQAVERALSLDTLEAGRRRIGLARAYEWKRRAERILASEPSIGTLTQ